MARHAEPMMMTVRGECVRMESVWMELPLPIVSALSAMQALIAVKVCRSAFYAAKLQIQSYMGQINIDLR